MRHFQSSPHTSQSYCSAAPPDCGFQPAGGREGRREGGDGGTEGGKEGREREGGKEGRGEGGRKGGGEGGGREREGGGRGREGGRDPCIYMYMEIHVHSTLA